MGGRVLVGCSASSDEKTQAWVDLEIAQSKKTRTYNIL